MLYDCLGFSVVLYCLLFFFVYFLIIVSQEIGWEDSLGGKRCVRVILLVM